MSKTNFAIFLILTTVLTAVLSAFIFSKILFAPVPEAVSKVNQLESSKSSFLLYPDLQKFNNCASSNLVIKQEYEFSKIKFLLVGTEQMCSSYNWYTQILKVMPDNSLKLVEASCGSAAQEKIYESPNKKYLLLENGCHSGACYHTNGFSVYNIDADKIIFTNLIDNDGRNYKLNEYDQKYGWQTTENVSWTPDSRVKYDEILLLSGACHSVGAGESLDNAPDYLVSRNLGLLYDPVGVG